MDQNSKDKLSQLLSNPDSLKALSSIAKGLMADENKQENSEQDKTPTSQEVLQQIPLTNPHFEQRLNLLRSIKPYLTDSRQSRVDSLVKAINIANLINTYGQNL
mgnify:CR=1 FL=1